MSPPVHKFLNTLKMPVIINGTLYSPSPFSPVIDRWNPDFIASVAVEIVKKCYDGVDIVLVNTDIFDTLSVSTNSAIPLVGTALERVVTPSNWRNAPDTRDLGIFIRDATQEDTTTFVPIDICAPIIITKLKAHPTFKFGRRYNSEILTEAS